MAYRRKYWVPGPQSLWHQDGHHALIRWRFVTHGSIDGFSRLIVFLHCSDNNRADTVSQLFLEAASKFGMPSRVRADCGGENLGVKEIMEEARGLDRGSFIAGRSVHNSRIERLWRDVYYAVIQTFYSLFYFLEGNGYLDVENERHMYALHYVYLAVINKCLHVFQEAFNHHPLRTEQNKSPYQLWTEGLSDTDRQHLTGVQDSLQGPIIVYGIDPDAPAPGADADVAIELPSTELPIPAEIQHEMLQYLPSVHITLKKASHFISNYIMIRNKLCSAGLNVD
jgi:hypothetical protein